MRRLTLSYSDCSGMDDISRVSCSELNAELADKVLTLHNICRKHEPKRLKLSFGPSIAMNDGQGNPLKVMLNEKSELQDQDLRSIFTGEGTASSINDPNLLTLMRNMARAIVEKTITDKDSSVAQETKNLVSILGQKAAEMNLINNIVERNLEEITEYYETVFNSDDVTIELQYADIREACHLVETSRLIYQTLIEADEFESNFCKKNSRIPKT